MSCMYYKICEQKVQFPVVNVNITHRLRRQLVDRRVDWQADIQTFDKQTGRHTSTAKHKHS